MPDNDSKIIIDEGWKEKVQREKEEAQRKIEESAPQENDVEPDLAEEGPDPSFNTMVGSLATQAMFSLGLIAPRDAKEVYINLDEAKFNIDLLAMLREKTAGNLTPQEEGNLREALSEMQRLYVARAQQLQEQALQEAGMNIMDFRPRQ